MILEYTLTLQHLVIFKQLSATPTYLALLLIAQYYIGITGLAFVIGLHCQINSWMVLYV